MNELTTVVHDGGLEGLQPGRYLCTLDPKEKANRQRMATAVQSRVPSLLEAVNLEIDVSHVLVHRINVADQETGEVKSLLRCVLFTEDGKLWSFCGAKALKDILLPMQLFGMALPYTPPQRFRVKREQVHGQQAYYLSLEWLDAEQPPKKGKSNEQR